MTADSMEQQRVALIRDFKLVASAPERQMMAELSPERQMVDTFANLCKLQEIDIYDVKSFDRQDIADEARGFVGVLHNIGYQAVHNGARQPTGRYKFGGEQIKAKLRDHYKNPDTKETTGYRAELQQNKELGYIRIARINEVYFPEVTLAHKLALELSNQGLFAATRGVRDLIIAMGMSIDDILKRQQAVLAETSD